MIKVNKKYLVFLAALAALYFVLLYFMPQRFNWFISLYQKDKNPFGAFVFKTLTDHSVQDSLHTSNRTIYELQELDEPSLFVLCEQFSPSSVDMDALLALADQGKNILISAYQMDTVFTDSLGVRMNELTFAFYIDQVWGEDSVGLKFSRAPFDTTAVYWLPTQMLGQYFEYYDPEKTQVLAENNDGFPVLLRIPFGRGNIILSSTPLVFSNFSILKANNQEYTAGLISLFPAGSIHWTEFYQLGRMEAQTPLRYVLSEPPLKWALFTLLISVLLLMIFEAKRKQRVIPIVKPLKNETLDFVKTIAGLYYQKKDHKDLAAKRILHMTEFLRGQLQIDINEELNEVITKVVAKTQSDENEVKKLFEQINYISSAKFISASELKSFMDRTEKIIVKS